MKGCVSRQLKEGRARKLFEAQLFPARTPKPVHYLEAERRTPPFGRGGCSNTTFKPLGCTMTKPAHEVVRSANMFDQTNALLSRHRGLAAALLVLMLGACGDPGSTSGAGGRTGGSGGASGGS